MAENVGAVALDIVVGKNEVDGYLGKLGGVAKGVGTAVGAGLAVASGAIMSIGTQAVASYGEYEQLVGGVQTLYGNAGKSMEEWVNEQAKALGERGIQADIKGLEDRWKAYAEVEQTVLKNAGNAYRTAGLSANEYMSTITGFTAALKQCIDDTSVVAEYADMAVTDMADNANKMGSSMESIQNAYQGFAKQNYTMLDNLKLGYGGTKEEMARLLADASAIAGIEYDISSYADVVDAIHVIQTEMGITGTTAKEASATIQGSISAMGGAWQNLLTGLTDPTQDFDKLITNLVDSVGNVLGNLLPRAKTVLSGVTNLITKLAPVIVAEIPALIQELLPPLLEGAITLMNSVLEVLPSLVGMLVSMLPTLIPMLINGLVAMVVMLCSKFDEIIQPILDNLPLILSVTVDALLSNLPLLLQGVIDLTIALVGAFLQVLGSILAPIGAWIYDNVIVPVGNSFSYMWDGIVNGAQSAWNWIVNGAQSAWNWIVNLLSTVGSWIYDNVIAPVSRFFVDLWNGIVNAFHTVIDPWVEIIRRASALVYNEIIKPILDYFVKLWNDIKSVFSVVGNWFQSTVIQPLTNAFANAWNVLKNGAVNAWNGVKSVFSSVATFFGNIFSTAWAKVKAVFSTGGKIFDGIKDGIVSGFKTVVNAIIRGINKVVSVPFNGINSVLETLRNIKILGVSPFGWIGTISVPQIPQLEQGGVLKKGQVGLLEGKGAEAVVPLERNLGWLDKIATLLSDRLDISRAFDLPMLDNVRAGNNNHETESKFDRIIALLEMLLEKEDGDITIPVQIGNELIDEYITNKNSRQILRSGGRA